MRNVVALSRGAANALVEREERRTGSRMAAYEIVAQTVGTSSEWLRKFISQKEGKEPRISVGFNLLQSYRAICERVEQAGASEQRLTEEIDAAIESFNLLDEAQARADQRAKEAANTD